MDKLSVDEIIEKTLQNIAQFINDEITIESFQDNNNKFYTNSLLLYLYGKYPTVMLRYSTCIEKIMEAKVFATSIEFYKIKQEKEQQQYENKLLDNRTKRKDK